MKMKFKILKSTLKDILAYGSIYGENRAGSIKSKYTQSNNVNLVFEDGMVIASGRTKSMSCYAFIILKDDTIKGRGIVDIFNPSKLIGGKNKDDITSKNLIDSLKNVVDIEKIKNEEGYDQIVFNNEDSTTIGINQTDIKYSSDYKFDVEKMKDMMSFKTIELPSLTDVKAKVSISIIDDIKSKDGVFYGKVNSVIFPKKYLDQIINHTKNMGSEHYHMKIKKGVDYFYMQIGSKSKYIRTRIPIVNNLHEDIDKIFTIGIDVFANACDDNYIQLVFDPKGTSVVSYQNIVSNNKEILMRTAYRTKLVE